MKSLLYFYQGYEQYDFSHDFQFLNYTWFYKWIRLVMKQINEYLKNL